jgi:hypothetical protein
VLLDFMVRAVVRDAGIQRLRPVMITVAAIILALFRLARHGGHHADELRLAARGAFRHRQLLKGRVLISHGAPWNLWTERGQNRPKADGQWRFGPEETAE